MDADDRAQLLQIVRLICGADKSGDSDELAERIVDEIEATGWNLTRPVSIKTAPTDLN